MAWSEHPGVQVLRLLGLFDRPAERRCIAALRTEPGIARLTDELADSGDVEWNRSLARLEQLQLVALLEDGSVDAHPLVLEHFAKGDSRQRSSGMGCGATARVRASARLHFGFSGY